MSLRWFDWVIGLPQWLAYLEALTQTAFVRPLPRSRYAPCRDVRHCPKAHRIQIVNQRFVVVHER